MGMDFFVGLAYSTEWMVCIAEVKGSHYMHLNICSNNI